MPALDFANSFFATFRAWMVSPGAVGAAMAAQDVMTRSGLLIVIVAALGLLLLKRRRRAHF